MVDPLADADDVRDIIDTDLTDSEINVYLDDATFDIDDVTDASEMDNDLRKKLERDMAALQILTLRERDTAEESRESQRLVYDRSRIEYLEKRIKRLDPTGDLLRGDKPEASFEVF